MIQTLLCSGAGRFKSTQPERSSVGNRDSKVTESEDRWSGDPNFLSVINSHEGFSCRATKAKRQLKPFPLNNGLRITLFARYRIGKIGIGESFPFLSRARRHSGGQKHTSILGKAHTQAGLGDPSRRQERVVPQNVGLRLEDGESQFHLSFAQ